MKIVDHTFGHIFIHLSLFTAFALLIPMMTVAFDGNGTPWTASPASFTAAILLIIVCVFFMYKMKESVSGVLQSLGAMVFLPGFLNVVLGFLDSESFWGITGLAVVKPVADFYIDHSVPSILSVAAVYMAVGGALYWAGIAVNKIRTRFNNR